MHGKPAALATRRGDSISIAVSHKGDLSGTYDSLLEFGFDSAQLLEDRILCSKNRVLEHGAHIESYNLDFALDYVSIDYKPVEGDNLAHAEAAYLLVSFLEACGNYLADSQSLAHAVSIALGKSLQEKKQD